jgi:hypothetical protein
MTGVAVESESAVRSTPAPASRRRSAGGATGPAALAATGAIVGALPAAHGLYALGAWAPAGAVAVLALVASVTASTRRPSAAALAAPVLLALLGVLQLVSSAWAESTAQASVEGHRTLVYAAALAVLVLLATTPRRRLWLIGGVAAGAAAVGIVTAVRLAGPDGPGLFFRARLFDPLGYSNATAAMLVVPFWPLVAVAERARRPVLAGAALALAGFLASLSILAQSRAGLGALVLSALIVVALVPGRLPRVAALAIVAAGVALAWPALHAVTAGADAATGLPSEGSLRDALRAAALAAAAGGVVWALAVTAARRAAPRLPGPPPRAVRLAALLAVAGAVAVAAVAADAGRVASDRWHDFRTQSAIQDGSRFATGGGNRYDFWRVAVAEWRDHPIAGVGAGNYDVRYLRERRSDEVVRQPHSIELQALAETGILGGGLLLALAAVLAAGALRGARLARREPAVGGVVVAALGVVTLFAVQTSADWLHLLPGLALVALAAAAVLAGMLGDARPARARRRLPVRIAVGAASIALITSLGVLWLADRHRADATAELARDPAAALRDAREAVRLDGDDLASWTVLAAAEARLDRYGAARAALERAAALEPHDPLPPALLGDLATRAGDRALAAASYARASSLNPRDATLAGLAREARR